MRDSRRSKGLDLVVLDQGVGEELLAELAEPLGVLGLQLDHPSDVDVLDPLEAERRQRPLDRLALRVEDALLGPDQHARLHRANLTINTAGPPRRLSRFAPIWDAKE